MLVSMLELKVPEETTWNGIAGVSSSDSSMSDAVLLLPARTIDEVAIWGGLEHRGDWMDLMTPL
jgi:hypothetical protein